MGKSLLCKTFKNFVKPTTESALEALDQVFEEARYSSHEMGDSHKAAAQQALSNVVSEIQNMAEIPAR